LKIDPEQAIKDAVDLATKSDAVIFVGGLTPEWESEGFDRPSLDLPGKQDETIATIAKANPKTIVCIQAVSKLFNIHITTILPKLLQGSAVAMPWVNQVDSIVQAWYLGNEVGNALADVIYGVVNPSGRLPLTLPARLEDIAAYPNLASENGQIHYREDLFVGYKHFHSRGIRPLFPFG
jgi:beta-glucosidase